MPAVDTLSLATLFNCRDRSRRMVRPVRVCKSSYQDRILFRIFISLITYTKYLIFVRKLSTTLFNRIVALTGLPCMSI